MSEKPKIDPSAISKKAIRGNHIKFENGEMLIWNVRGTILSNYSLAYLCRSLEHLDCKTGIDAIYWMLFNQAVGATIMTKYKYGIKEKVLENVIGQGEMLGYGKTLLVRTDFKASHFIFESSSALAKEYLSIFGHSKTGVCHHLRGLLAGTIQTLTNEEVVGIEKKCIAKGDKSCVFWVKKRLDLEKSDDSEIKNQIPSPFPTPTELGDKRSSEMLNQKRY